MFDSWGFLRLLMLARQICVQSLHNELPNLSQAIAPETQLRVYVQHGGQPPHLVAAVQMYLRHRFPARWIGRGIPKHWPPRSPGINRLDVYLWGHIKDVAYQHEWKHEIRRPVTF
jgi:hypothetical protein